VKLGFSGGDPAGHNNETWLTPPGVLSALGAFDLDPCAAPSPRPWPTAARHIELPECGLAAEWSGRIWCNPPYGAQAAKWLAKMAAHANGVALVFARTETKAFHDHVWPRAHALLFLRGRLTFIDQHGKAGASNAGAPSVLIAYGEANAVQLESCGLDGYFVRLPDPTHTPCSGLFSVAA